MAKPLRQHTDEMRRLTAQFFNEGRAANAPCWICGGAIDYSVTPNSTPRSHNLDHYYPVSLYPELQHDPANFRHSHASCNNRRGNGRERAQSERLGDLYPILDVHGTMVAV